MLFLLPGALPVVRAGQAILEPPLSWAPLLLGGGAPLVGSWAFAPGAASVVGSPSPGGRCSSGWELGFCTWSLLCRGLPFSRGEVLLWLGAGLLGVYLLLHWAFPAEAACTLLVPLRSSQADCCGISMRPFQVCASNPPHVHLPPPHPVLPSHSQESLPSLWSESSGLTVLITSCVSCLKQFCCVCF